MATQDWKGVHEAAKVINQELDRLLAFFKAVANVRESLGTHAEEAMKALEPLEAHKEQLALQVTALEDQHAALTSQLAEMQRKTEAQTQALSEALAQHKAKMDDRRREIDAEHRQQTETLGKQWQEAKKQHKRDMDALAAELHAAQQQHHAAMQTMRHDEAALQRRIEEGEKRLKEFAQLVRQGGLA